MSASRISVITPSFNQGQFIERTIRSVLDQSANVDYVVCDGGSTDGTVDILKRYQGRLRYVSEPDHGQADAVNKGFSMTDGDLIGWLNSDDVYYPGALNYVRGFFDDHPDVDIVYADAEHIDEADRVIEPYYTEDWDYERFKEVCFVCQPTVFFRRRIVSRYGQLDASLRYCMDYEYWLRVGATMPFVRLPRVVGGSRLHAATKTLGSRVPVHAEINTMLRRRAGQVPTRWLYNYAFAVYDGHGWPRADLHRHGWTFGVALGYAYLRWRRTLPLSAVKTVSEWLWQSWRSSHQLGSAR